MREVWRRGGDENGGRKKSSAVYMIFFAPRDITCSAESEINKEVCRMKTE
jgi:hypothetical protein